MEEDNNQKDMVETAVEDAGKKAGKSALNGAKKGAKFAVKKVLAAIAHAIMSIIMAILPYIAIIVVIVVIISGFAFLLELFEGEDSSKAVYSSLGIEIRDGQNSYVCEAVKIVAGDDGYHYEFKDDMDEKIENAIKEIYKENTIISLEQKETVKNFIKAEAMTELPNLGGNAVGPNQFQGVIDIKRYTPDKERGEVEQADDRKEITLRYVNEITFNDYLSNNNSEALETFTLVGDNKNLLTATWNWQGDSTTYSKNTEIDYRAKLNQFIMPFEYPLFFLIDGEDEEFANELAKLAMNSSAEIAIIDKVEDKQTVVDVQKDYWEYLQYYQAIENEDGTYSKGNKGGTAWRDSADPEPEVTTTYSEYVSTIIELKDIKSWFSIKEGEITNDFKPVETQTSGPNDNSTEEEIPPMQYNVLQTDGNGDVSSIADITTYNRKTTTTTTTTTSSNSFKTDFGGEVKDNSEDFSDLYKKYASKLRIEPDWLFELLENSGKTSNMIDLTKYLLYKATGDDYGVIDFSELDLFDDVSLNKTLNSGTMDSAQLAMDFIALHENGYTYYYLNTDKFDDKYDAPGYGYESIKASVTRDKKYYKCKSDGLNSDNGTRNFGYGVLHYYTYTDSFGNQDKYREVGVNIEQEKYKYTYAQNNESILEVEKVDQVFKKIVLENRQKLIDKAAEVGKTLQNYELDAMCYMMHCYGPGVVNTIISDYVKYGNTEALRQNFSLDFFHRGNAEWNEQIWKLFHEGIYIDGVTGEEMDLSKYRTSSSGISTVNSFGFNLYNSDGSVNKTEINNLYNKETDIVNNPSNYEFFKGNGLQYKQCTWWANARASTFLSKYGDKYKAYPTISGHGYQYWGINQQNGYFEYGQEPRPNSILCYPAGGLIGDHGHVTYVEAVDYVNKKIYISHCGSGENWHGITELDWDGVLWGVKPQGYIYLAPKQVAGEVVAENGTGYDNVFKASNGNVYKLFLQRKYSHVYYWGNNIGRSGCGPTSAAIILSGFGTNDTPETVAQYPANGMQSGEAYFFTSRNFRADLEYIDWAYSDSNKNWQKIINHLKSGNPMVVNINCATKVYLNDEGYDGHYVTFLDYNPEKDEIFIGDPWRSDGCQGGTGWFKVSYLKTIQYAFPWIIYVYN